MDLDLKPPLRALLLVWAALIHLGGCAASSHKNGSPTPSRALPAESGANTPAWSSPVPEASAQKANPPSKGDARPAPQPIGPVKLRYPRSHKPWLGVELRATSPTEAGVEIVRILPGSPAEEAQLIEGDILLSMGQTPMLTPTDVSDWVTAQVSGSSHPLTILRKGAQQLLRARLVGMPEFEDRLRLALEGHPAPEIAGVSTFQGEAASLKELKGQVVILEFWASYCGVCRYLAPVLDDWHRLYRPQGGHVLGITVDPPQVGLQVAAQTGMHYTLASDPRARISHAYLASQIPTVIVIDRQGIVRDVMVGYSKRRLVETKDLIERLLALDP